MISIALIGGTGTGKSTVARFLAERFHAFWLDSDAIGHALLQEAEIIERITDRFGHSILEDNKINRKKLGEIVFYDAKALKDLNAIIHPLIRKRLLDGKNHAQKEGYSLCVMDGALLMDIQVEEMVDEVWAVEAEKATRIRRLQAGRMLSPEKIQRIMENQISAEEYRAYARYFLSTEVPLEEQKQEIAMRLQQIRSRVYHDET